MSQECRFPSLFIMPWIKKIPFVVGKFTAFQFPWVSACFVLSEEIKENTPLNLSTSFSASFSSNFCMPIILHNLYKCYLLRENNEISQYPYNELLCYIPMPNNIVVFPLRDALFGRSDKLLFSCSKIVQHSVFTVLSISKRNKNLMGFEQEHSHSVCELRLNWSVMGKQSIVCNLFTEVHASKWDFIPVC